MFKTNFICQLTILAIGLFLSSSVFAQAAEKPKVGVIISKYNAELMLANEPTGYPRMTRVLREFKDGDFELIPIIDPGTTDDPDVVKACGNSFPNAKPIDLTDADALSKLDVIVASHIMRLKPESLAAIDKAIENGTGLFIRMYFGISEPGTKDPTVDKLIGLKPGTIKYLKNEFVEAQATCEHPIVGSLASSMERVTFSPNGMYGQYTGTPLIEVCDDATVKNTNRTTETIALVYTVKVGKGNVVVCPFAGSKAIPAALEKAGEKSFGTRCIEWLIAEAKSEQKPVERK